MEIKMKKIMLCLLASVIFVFGGSLYDVENSRFTDTGSVASSEKRSLEYRVTEYAGITVRFGL